MHTTIRSQANELAQLVLSHIKIKLCHALQPKKTGSTDALKQGMQLVPLVLSNSLVSAAQQRPSSPNQIQASSASHTSWIRTDEGTKHLLESHYGGVPSQALLLGHHTDNGHQSDTLGPACQATLFL
jgi:hypothetical protein